ncbi:hypothetical protein EV356DRAFT_504590 [Viridothelium virens]|uniref:AAA+ ATPase lid domain-containing protein n=1 Tax=Viridothelium virens TaxID=1048519 RepID=A0A6A6H4Q2_VIRVR|nr:hypothetical protein EV356DRAFT_504590 [Viridothelium virens]
MALVVHFDRLDEVARAKIRGNCIKRMCEDNRFAMTEQAKSEVAKLDKDDYDWSGREINSVFKNACDFAQWARAKLDANVDPRSGPVEIEDTHIKEAVEVIHGFEEYLKKDDYEGKSKAAREKEDLIG